MSAKYSASEHRDFTLASADFSYIFDFVKRQTGIFLTEEKQDMVHSRLSKRLRTLGITDFADYRSLLSQEGGGEVEHFTNAITTNLTSFFREKHHFEELREKIVPELLERYRKTQRIRIWSAGCSTGEEAYSIAMVLREEIPDIDAMDIRILATDIDSEVLAKARSGVYGDNRIESLDEATKRRWFTYESEGKRQNVLVAPELQRLIRFNRLNLMAQWPMKGTFDVIFCRNVVIYFDKPTQRTLFSRFTQALHPEGRLVIGHSETLHGVSDSLELIGKTIYRRIG
ncbi:MAG: protein-glutamate O-methyltransferase CheR [Halioglobus sp.]